MTKALTTMTKTTVHSTRARSAVKKKNDAAADELQKIVAAEKRDREDKKKKRAYEKKVEEEMKKKSDEEKAQAIVRKRQWIVDQEKIRANLATISPPNPDIALVDGATEGEDWSEDEDDDQGIRTNGISPNSLFAKEAMNATEKPIETLDLTGENSPFKKKSRNTSSSLKSTTRYSTSTFNLTQKVHEHTYAKTFIEAAITLKSEDKPKEFIAAIKLLMTNGKYPIPTWHSPPSSTTSTSRSLN